jgi:hypothetical protein
MPANQWALRLAQHIINTLHGEVPEVGNGASSIKCNHGLMLELCFQSALAESLSAPCQPWVAEPWGDHQRMWAASSTGKTTCDGDCHHKLTGCCPSGINIVGNSASDLSQGVVYECSHVQGFNNTL